ncbi:uncharacterized protein [Haliotis cracherodii]|uniref:uncharacterized protein n=1 Tax=Haliotis cracherodii TaxID=6455 RepID=UPI0039ED37A6
MTVLTNLCIAYMALSTFANQCHDNQRCSDCQSSSGHCISECDAGYYDQRCKSVCSKNCRSNTCVMSNTGSDNCTEGCVPGYQGTSCNTPCDNPGGTCTACPGGCDGGYCQLSSSCVSGCVDAYYGTDCKTLIDMKVEGMTNITVSDNESVTFRCVVQGCPPPGVFLVHAGNNTPTMYIDRKNNTVYERAVRISSCSQLGRYYCRATNSTGTDEQLHAVELLAIPRKRDVKDCEIETPNDGKAPSGRIAFTLCAYPEPVVTKMHFERHETPKDITNNNKYSLSMKWSIGNTFQCTLTIANISDEDFGAYTFSFANDERDVDILIIASHPKEITDMIFTSIAIIIASSLVGIPLVFAAIACLVRRKTVRDYWHMKFVQPYITPTNESRVSPCDIDAQIYEVIGDSCV